MNQMHQDERSLLFYVLDALRNAPQKSQQVLRRVEQEGSSPEFKRHIRTLQDAPPDAVTRVSEEVRAEIL